MKFKKFFAAVSAAVMITTALGATTAHAITDPNGDGTINIYDVICISKYLAGTACPTDVSRLDYDGNGIVSELDAYIISCEIM